MRIALMGFTCVLALAGIQAAYADAPPPKHNNVCINVQDIDSMSYPDDKTILFRMWAGPVKVWRNDLPRACSGLKFEKGIAWEIRGGEVCSHMQVFYVLRRGIPCMLGDFTPVEMRAKSQ
jgi:hypothetical protein